MQQQSIASYVVLAKFFSINNFDFEMTRPIVMFMMQYIIYLTISVFMVLA